MIVRTRRKLAPHHRVVVLLSEPPPPIRGWTPWDMDSVWVTTRQPNPRYL